MTAPDIHTLAKEMRARAEHTKHMVRTHGGREQVIADADDVLTILDALAQRDARIAELEAAGTRAKRAAEFLAMSARLADWAGGEGIHFHDARGWCDPQDFVADYLNEVEPTGPIEDHVRAILAALGTQTEGGER